MSRQYVITDSDPSIDELSEQLDAFVAAIQAKLEEVAQMDMPVCEDKPLRVSEVQLRSFVRLTAVRQYFADRMEYSNE